MCLIINKHRPLTVKPRTQYITKVNLYVLIKNLEGYIKA